jgi:hypothetical protein
MVIGFGCSLMLSERFNVIYEACHSIVALILPVIFLAFLNASIVFIKTSR